MLYVWSITFVAGVALQLLVVAAILRRGWTRLKALFIYVVVLFLTTLIDAAAFYSPSIYSSMSRYYWVDDAVRQILIFILVISLIYAGRGHGQSRWKGVEFLGPGVAAFSIVSLYITHDPQFWVWMTQLSRNLGFLAAVLNFVLWVVLLQSRQRDRTLLMISGGMGIQMAGKAIGHSLRQLALRQLSPATALSGDLIIVLSHLFCLYVWWQALRLPPPEGDPQLP
jgi:hypothetical protein